jgi:hypothetical protein
MSSRADKFLEGFKLGSLGVSKKLVVSGPTIKIIREGQNQYAGDVISGPKPVPYICWKEDDGWIYFFEVTEDFNQRNKFVLALSGGTKLVLRGRDDFQVSDDFEWLVESSPYTYEKCLRLFDSYVPNIKTDGVDSKLKEFARFRSAGSPTEFKEWLESKGIKS